MTTSTPIETLGALLPTDVALGAPDRAGSLIVFPVLASCGALEYRCFAEASALGFTVRELERASVNEVLAVNPLDVPVLLYEGEEVVAPARIARSMPRCSWARAPR